MPTKNRILRRRQPLRRQTLELAIETRESRLMLATTSPTVDEAPDADGVVIAPEDGNYPLTSIVSSPASENNAATSLVTQLVSSASPLEIDTRSGGYDDFEFFGGAFIAAGDLRIEVDLETSPNGGVYLVQLDTGHDVALIRSDGNWIVTTTENGVFGTLLTLVEPGLSGSFTLEFSNEFHCSPL